MNNEIATALRGFANQLDLAHVDLKAALADKDLEIAKLKRGNETLQEVIKMKDDVYQELIQSLRPKKEDKKS